MKSAKNKNRLANMKDAPKLTPGKPPQDKTDKCKVLYDRIIVFDFTPKGSIGYIYGLNKAQTAASGVTNKELNIDIFRFRNREQRRFLNIWDPPHNHLVLVKVDSRKYFDISVE